MNQTGKTAARTMIDTHPMQPEVAHLLRILLVRDGAIRPGTPRRIFISIMKKGVRAAPPHPLRTVPNVRYAFCATMNFLMSGVVVRVLGSNVKVVLWR